MNTPHDLSYHTDFIFHRLKGEIEEHEDHWVVRTPHNPTFWFGNFILFKTAPGPGDFARWMARHAEVWNDSIKHVTFGWDEEREGEVAPFIEAGFRRSHGYVSTLDALPQNARVNPELEVRPLASAADWEAQVELQAMVDHEDFDYPDDGGVFRRQQVADYQQLSTEGHGHWWGAWQDDQLVGSMGLYFDERREVGRFQNVATHIQHRRQGVCHSLLAACARDAFERVGASQLVIVTGTDDDNPAVPTYRNFGFQTGPQSYALIRRPRAGD